MDGWMGEGGCKKIRYEAWVLGPLGGMASSIDEGFANLAPQGREGRAMNVQSDRR